MRTWIAACVLALISLVLAAPAFACMGDKVLYDEDFSFADSAWGPLSGSFDISNGAATLKPDANKTRLPWNSNFTFSDADICATVAASGITDAADAYGGLLFWVKDNQNFFAYVYTVNGSFEVLHYLNGNWTANAPLPWTRTDAIKQGAGAQNMLRVTLQGQVVTLGMNGMQVARFRAQAPDGNWSVGMFGASEAAKPDEFSFRNLKVTNVVGTSVTASPPPSAAPQAVTQAAPQTQQTPNSPVQNAPAPQSVPAFKDANVGKWTIIESRDQGTQICTMGVDTIAAGWGFEANLLDDARGPILEMQIYSHELKNPDFSDLVSYDPKPVGGTTRIDGATFTGDSTVQSELGIVSYILRYRAVDAAKMASRLRSGARSIQISAADKRFNVPTADFSKAFAFLEQCYPLWLGHSLKWQ